MFHISDAAKTALQELLQETAKPYFRLQMRHSCFMKLKLTTEEVKNENDIVVELEGYTFVIHKDHVHYFQNKQLDFIPDQHGFKQFEIL